MKISFAAVTLALVATATLLSAYAAHAHEYWLAPSTYDARPGQPVTIAAVAGTGFRGEKKPWAPDHAVRLVARTSRLLDLGSVASPGELSWARFSPADDGGALLAFQSDFTPIQLPAATFDAYLADQGLDAPLAARARMTPRPAGRERYRRCAKAWLSGHEAARALQPVGLPLEVLPLEVPGTAGLLHLRVLWNGQPLANARVKTWRHACDAAGALADPESRDSVGVASEARTDVRGEVAVRCAEPGEWLVSAVHMVPSSDVSKADWESTWASLTFVRPPAVVRR
jgi:uncharacterized GH25 family protein